jgi:hypothetical protein
MPTSHRRRVLTVLGVLAAGAGCLSVLLRIAYFLGTGR